MSGLNAILIGMCIYVKLHYGSVVKVLMLTRRLVFRLSNRKVQLQEHIYINSIHQVLNYRKGHFKHLFANVYMYEGGSICNENSPVYPEVLY